MKIEHVAVYENDLEGMKSFYETWFGGKANDLYHNPRTGFKSYFLAFESGARLELMHKEEMEDLEKPLSRTGWAHLTFALGSESAVDTMTEALKKDGFEILSGPRRTGDGYYESCFLDPEGNQIEITV